MRSETSAHFHRHLLSLRAPYQWGAGQGDKCTAVCDKQPDDSDAAADVFFVCLLASDPPTGPPLAPTPYRGGPPKPPELSPCILIGERRDRWLFSGLARFSTKTWRSGIGSVLIKHPAGNVLLDPAFGRKIAADLRKAPLYFRLAMGDERTKQPLVDLLHPLGIAPKDIAYALVTHAHWDHVGALRDLPKAKVIISNEELAWARSHERYLEHGAMRPHLELPEGRFAPFDFQSGPFDVFASSHDVFGDGSIVAVPLPGHTPGSTGYWVRSRDGRAWLFTGDATWTMEGIELPAHKNPIPRSIADIDADTLSKSLALLHGLYRQRPEVSLIPSHDLDALEKLPACQPEGAVSE